MSLAKNISYNLLVSVVNIIFPIITFPYLARVLGPERIGSIDFALSVVEIAKFFVLLGVQVYGVREIARYKDDPERTAKTYSELLLINVFMMVITVCAYLVLINSVSRFSDPIFLILGVNIVTIPFWSEWFHKGIENFKFIAIRSAVFKIIALICLFLFVRSANDYYAYGWIIVLSFSGPCIAGFIQARKHVRFSGKELHLRRHFDSLLIFTLSAAAVSIYSNLDKVMLGFLTTNEVVSYYTTAMKVTRIVLIGITSFGVVMLPRLSHLMSKGDTKNYLRVRKQSVTLVLLSAIPAAMGISLIAEPIVLLFAGPEFSQATSTLRISSLLVIMTGISNFTGSQVLLSNGREKLFLISVTAGAVIDGIMNLLLIPRFGQDGAMAATIMTELSVVIIQLLGARDLYRGVFKGTGFLKILISTAVMGTVVYLLQGYFSSIVIKALLGAVSGMIVYTLMLFLLRHELAVMAKRWLAERRST